MLQNVKTNEFKDPKRPFLLFKMLRSAAYLILRNKPENPFQNYELAKKILEEEKKFLCLKNTLIQPLEVQKPETGQKTGPRTTRKILCANEPV